MQRETLLCIPLFYAFSSPFPYFFLFFFLCPETRIDLLFIQAIEKQRESHIHE